MKTSNQAGFTIIETMLFLGITGLLVMGLLAGAGTSINIQRYHDSVTSLQSTLQQQYSEVANVNNESTGGLECYGDNQTNPVGQSDCVIVGRYISSVNGSVLSIKSVVGYISSTTIFSSIQDDIDAINAINIRVSPVNGQTYDIEWGSSLVRSDNSNPLAFSMLVLRSPVSGVVRTFINSNEAIDDSDISTLVSDSALIEPLKACVESNGLFNSGKSAIFINPSSTSASGVEMQGEAFSGC
ncbi:MAG: type II secretion system protein [Candidatus Saccharimonadales bacterium]